MSDPSANSPAGEAVVDSDWKLTPEQRARKAQIDAWLADAISHGALEPGGASQDWRRFDLFAALRWIEAKAAPVPLGTSLRASDDAVRLHFDVGLTFAPTSIARMEWERGLPVLYQHVLGLFGPNGPMPLHLTEYVADRERHFKDATLARFADVFHHRIIQLFYRAWAQGEPVAEANREAESLFTTVVDALTGTNALSLRAAAPELQGPRRDQAHHLLGYVRTREGLEKRLIASLGHAVHVREFRVVRDSLDVADRLHLGRPGPASRLGEASIIGARLLLGQSSIQVDFLNLDLATFLRYQTDSEHRALAVDILTFHLGQDIGWRISLQLRQDQIPRARLGRQGHLGQTMWLGSLSGASKDYSFTDAALPRKAKFSQASRPKTASA
jgi:type VI secretion system protein ImpH